MKKSSDFDLIDCTHSLNVNWTVIEDEKEEKEERDESGWMQ